MVSLESIYSFKSFLNNIGCRNYEFREKKFYINPEKKMNYLFNSSIQGVEDSDLILLIGTNPRHEATMLNARIRKAYNKNQTHIYSIGNAGDLTYDYTILGEDLEELKKIFDGKSEFNKKLSLSQKPLFIIGESALSSKNGKFILEETKNYLNKNNFINEKWNSFNILFQNASSIGALDLNFYNIQGEKNFCFFDSLENKDFELLYLLSSDNLEIKKTNEFIIYQGSHGDRGAEIADIILPSAAYTEQDGLYINIEGRVQECRKASYPPGEAKEDWKIFNLLNKRLNNRNLFSDLTVIKNELIKKIPNFSDIGILPKRDIENIKNLNSEFTNEPIKLLDLDYYYSNAIARSSKTMSDCRNIKLINKKNGTTN